MRPSTHLLHHLHRLPVQRRYRFSRLSNSTLVKCPNTLSLKEVKARYAANGVTTNLSVLRTGTHEGVKSSAHAMMMRCDVSANDRPTASYSPKTYVVWDFDSHLFDSKDPFPKSKPFSRISHNCQTVRVLLSDGFCAVQFL